MKNAFTRFLHLLGHLLARTQPDWSAMEDIPGKGSSSVCHLCEKAFTRAGDLKRHLLTHSGKKIHKCVTCEKAFALAGNLKKHILTHTGVKAHKCGTCDKAFTQTDNLKAHNLIHRGEKSHICGT